MIPQSLSKRRIAITGSTGFVGTALVERLLRGVPDCELILLVRDGRRTPAARRTTREILANDAFDRLKEFHATAAESFEEMCERRIRQLQPGHPLPIRLEHMNQPNHAVIQQHQNQISQLQQQHLAQTQQLRDEIEQLRRANRLSSQTSGPQQFDMGNSFGGEAQHSGLKAPASANVASIENTSQNPHMNSSSVEYSIQLNQQVTQMR